MARNMREAMKPLVPDLRAAVRGIPSSGKGHTGLRDKIARGVQVKVSTAGRSVGARIRVDARLLPDNAKSLPELLEGTVPWRHPVYGNTDNWVTQAPHPFFYRTLKPHESAVQTRMAQVLKDTARSAGFH